ncbi:alpha/beta hydrolase [Burkholderia stagnalis]|uniref:Alpha/beta hydrolase n=1 Tax=Burkholderia stagnalis TaxID=1503054 RepID=A0A6L3N5A9_9BURK|nr:MULTISPECIES: alpha/beta hydrolase [Burkholderia cepacia complex]KAB0641589.1 alpha/beta hydrolase [Burkholderia stagnalis]KVH73590.1 alpha/beta hydrolase [Burkholderia cepacia]KVO47832.1 alpha/beta hydrolase [Burkholderia stagnalis]KVO69996.1 alpha/beta hydrolase [Burkholderia stagnalis]KVW59298.1 alpha/beta hydrolase [Burkholderia stagnalis]
MPQSVTFPNRSANIAADLYVPPNFDAGTKYPAIICGHPISSCKEQTASIYAQKLAALGFVTLAFDASHQGASGGEPRYIEDPASRVEDFRCAVDYLVTLDYVDDERIGVLGICGGGGYAVNAAMTERRIKAVGTVVAANYGRIMREGDLSADAALATLDAIGKQRTAEARGADPLIVTYIPASEAARKQAGVNDIDIVEAVDYYTTPRGQQSGSPNKLRFSRLQAAVGFDAFHLAEQLLTQPLQIVIGSRPGAFGSYRDGYELFERARSSRKNLFVVEGASHYDLYDKPEYVEQAMSKLGPFFQDNLGPAR